MGKNNKVILRKVGGFYQVFDDDSYVLFSLFGYQIKNGRLGFPVRIKNKVQNTLEEKKISYCFKIKDGQEESKDFKSKNRYDVFLNQGKNKYEIEQKKKSFQEKIRDLPLEKVEHLLSYIDKVLNEE